MDKKSELLNIKPFNEVWYIDCVYMVIFPAMYYFNRDILPFLAHTIYTYEKKDFFINTHSALFKLDLETILCDLGFQFQIIGNNNGLINESIKFIQKGIPVYVPIDLFYYHSDNPLCAKDVHLYYKKNHKRHSFLATGYNDADKTFAIIDTSSGKCFASSISFSMLSDCYKGYLDSLFAVKMEKYMHDTFRYAFGISASRDSALENDSKNMQKYAAVYLLNITENREQILAGTENIKHIPALYELWLNDPLLLEKAYLAENSEYKYSRNFSNNSFRKQCQLYGDSRFFGSGSKLLSLLNAINKNLTLIKNFYMISLLRKECDNEILTTITESAEKILEMENRYYNELFSFPECKM